MSLYFSCILFSSVFFFKIEDFILNLYYVDMSSSFCYFNSYPILFFTGNIYFRINHNSTLYTFHLNLLKISVQIWLILHQLQTWWTVWWVCWWCTDIIWSDSSDKDLQWISLLRCSKTFVNQCDSWVNHLIILKYCFLSSSTWIRIRKSCLTILYIDILLSSYAIIEDTFLKMNLLFCCFDTD